MRIVVSAEAFYPATDADTRTVKAIVDHLVDGGHHVLLLAPAPGLADYRGQRVARITLSEGRGGQVREALAAFGADSLIALSPAKVGRKALKHARKLAVPTLVVQTQPVGPVDGEAWSRTVAARADRFVVTAEWLLDRCRILGATDPSVWLPGTDALGFAPSLRDAYLHDSYARARSKGGPRVVIGHAGPLKRSLGVRRLADAARVPGGRLVVIGEGKQKAWLAAQVPDVKLTGHLADNELATALASLDILVQPSEVETCGHLLRAGMASGLAVVAPATGAVAQIVADGDTGLLYDPADPASLRRSVATLIADTDLRERLGAAARQAALTRDWSAAVAELLEQHLPASARSDTSAA